MLVKKLQKNCLNALLYRGFTRVRFSNAMCTCDSNKRFVKTQPQSLRSKLRYRTCSTFSYVELRCRTCFIIVVCVRFKVNNEITWLILSSHRNRVNPLLLVLSFASMVLNFSLLFFVQTRFLDARVQLMSCF